MWYGHSSPENVSWSLLKFEFTVALQRVEPLGRVNVTSAERAVPVTYIV